MAHILYQLTWLLVPLLGGPAPQRPAAPPIERWRLTTGSRIAIARFRAVSDAAGRTAVFFLHGGPGAYQLADLERGAAWYAHLAELRHDIYVYDQVGSGLSDRLADPRQYSVARHVADLEAIRLRTGAARIVLIGDSWGASLACAYIAAHPEQVERAIFTSPGSMHAGAWLRPAATPHIAPELVAWTREHRGDMAYRRLLETDRLLREDVRRAHAFFGDAEMDRLWDDFVTDTIMPTTVHDPARTRPPRMSGMGGWVQIMTSWDQVNRAPDPRTALARFRRPVLILRGDADYLPAGMADEYARVLPQATFVRLPRTGHLIWLEQPQAYASRIEQFLADR